MSFETNIRTLQRAVENVKGEARLHPDGVRITIKRDGREINEIASWHEIALWRFPSLPNSFVHQMMRSLM